MRTIQVKMLGALLFIVTSAAAAAAPVIEQPEPPLAVAAKAASIAPASDAIDPAALVLAHRIVAAVIPPDRQSEIFAGMMSNLATQMRSSTLAEFKDPGLQKILSEFLDGVPKLILPVTEKHIPSILEAMARAYVRNFSYSDLVEIKDFATTPAGARYLSGSSAVLGDPDVATANEAYFVDVMTLMPNIEHEIKTKVTAYLKAHPGVAKKLSGQKATH